MKYIHYWRFNRQWYMKINDSSASYMIPGRNEENIYSYILQEDYLIPDSLDLTHRQIKEKLTAEHPGCVLIKEIAYHEGARWFGYKHGSRQ